MNNNDIYKKFNNNINELSKLKIKELKSISNSIGLSNNNNSNKEELYENIKNYIIKFESIEPIDLINPFNKQQPELIIKDNTEPIELPFWKVFRNKSIFINIFSNFKNKRLNGYFDLKCSKKFLKGFSNSINILIDNIKCNSNNNNKFIYHQIINNNQDICNIISNKFKNNNETKSFYNLLFSTFSSTSSTSSSTNQNNSINFNNDIEKWIKYILNNSNFIALEEFIKIFKISKENVINEFMKFENEQQQVNNGIFKKIYNNFKNNRELKFINYLIESDYPIVSSFLNKINKYSLESFSIPFTIKLKVLFKKFKLFESIYQATGNGNQFINENKESIQKIILKINEIGNINQYFTNDQLNETISNFLYNDHQVLINEAITISELKEIIYKYYKSIILFLNGNQNNHEQSKVLPYQFYFKNKEYIYNFVKLKPELINEVSIYQYFSLLFVVTFKNDSNEKLKLISSIFKPSTTDDDFLINKINNLKRKFSFFEYISNSILSSNDIIIIDYFFKIINEPSTTVYRNIYGNEPVKTLILNHINPIKTIEMLDYLFYNYRDIVLKLNENAILIKRFSFLNFEIIQHFETLMSSINFKIVPFLSIGISLDLQLLNRVLNNPSIYKIKLTSAQFYKAIENPFINFNHETTYFTLSNIQLKQSNNEILDLDKLFSIDFNKISSNLHLNPILNFLFKNLSIDSILMVLNENLNENIEKLNIGEIKLKFLNILTSTNSNNNNISIGNNSSGGSGDNTGNLEIEPFLIEKSNSISFKISIKFLFLSLYYLDLSNEILYLFDKVPRILEINNGLNLTIDYNFYNNFSNFNLELFINYFIKKITSTTRLDDGKNNSNTENLINQLYQCIYMASSKGYISIFKKLISIKNYHKLLFNIKNNDDDDYESLFNLKQFINLIQNCNNFELVNLLLKYINFSTNTLNTLNSYINNVFETFNKISI